MTDGIYLVKNTATNKIEAVFCQFYGNPSYAYTEAYFSIAIKNNKNQIVYQIFVKFINSW